MIRLQWEGNVALPSEAANTGSRGDRYDSSRLVKAASTKIINWCGVRT